MSNTLVPCHNGLPELRWEMWRIVTGDVARIRRNRSSAMVGMKMTLLVWSVFIFWVCLNKAPHAKWLTQQKDRLAVLEARFPDHSVSRVGSFWGLCDTGFLLLLLLFFKCSLGLVFSPWFWREASRFLFLSTWLNLHLSYFLIWALTLGHLLQLPQEPIPANALEPVKIFKFANTKESPKPSKPPSTCPV